MIKFFAGIVLGIMLTLWYSSSVLQTAYTKTQEAITRTQDAITEENRLLKEASTATTQRDFCLSILNK